MTTSTIAFYCPVYDYYNPHKTYGLSPPASAVQNQPRQDRPLLQVPKCFYPDRVCGISQPPGYPFALNAAVDRLPKKESDLRRAKHTGHALRKAYGVDAVPFDDPRMDQ